MATWDYGYAPADVVTDTAGDVRPGIELRVWDAEVAGKAVAVQQDRGDGWVLVSRVLTDDVGRFRFRAEVGPTVWVEDASGRRWRLDAWQTLGTMIDSAQTAVTVSQAASSTADKALDTAASAEIAQGAQLAANIGNSFWMTGEGAPPTTFDDTVDAPIVGARYRDDISKKTWVAALVLVVSGEVTVRWEQIGPLPADMSATVEAQRLAKIVPGHANPKDGTPETIPPAGSRFIIQAGSAVATVNAAGDFSFNWPEAFPTGILSVQLTSGDHAAHNGAIAVHNATTLTVCHANAVGNTSGAVRCDYTAIGY